MIYQTFRQIQKLGDSSILQIFPVLFNFCRERNLSGNPRALINILRCVIHLRGRSSLVDLIILEISRIEPEELIDTFVLSSFLDVLIEYNPFFDRNFVLRSIAFQMGSLKDIFNNDISSGLRILIKFLKIARLNSLTYHIVLYLISETMEIIKKYCLPDLKDIFDLENDIIDPTIIDIPGRYSGLVSMLLIQYIWYFLTVLSPKLISDFLTKYAFVIDFLKVECEYSFQIFIKIFSLDSPAMYSVLILLARNYLLTCNLFDVFKAYRLLIEGCDGVEDFCMLHVKNNPEGIRFVTEMVRLMTANESFESHLIIFHANLCQFITENYMVKDENLNDLVQALGAYLSSSEFI